MTVALWGFGGVIGAMPMVYIVTLYNLGAIGMYTLVPIGALVGVAAWLYSPLLDTNGGMGMGEPEYGNWGFNE